MQTQTSMVCEQGGHVYHGLNWWDCVRRHKQYIPWNMRVVPVLFCFVLVDFTHILQGSFTGTGAILWLPQCQWSNPEGYGSISHESTWRWLCNHKKTIHSQMMFIFYGIYCKLKCIVHRSFISFAQSCQIIDGFDIMWMTVKRTSCIYCGENYMYIYEQNCAFIFCIVS